MFEAASLQRRRLSCLTVILFTLTLLTLASIASATPRTHKRDAFTSVRGTRGDRSLKTVGTRPAGAYARSLAVTRNANIFTWYPKTPHNEADVESAFIIIHGVNRNANTYFSILNNAFTKARDANLGSARPNSIRVAPLFFSTNEDRGAYDKQHLAWGDSNAWVVGEASTNPPKAAVSSFTVLDSLLTRFANRRKYPRMKTITFVAHGGGAQLLQRYAVLGKVNPDPARLSVRYVIGDPSSSLYFTGDRPVGVDKASCPAWNDYRYGIRQYTPKYGVLNAAVAPALFRSYAAKEVRYVVGLDDTESANGDQTCMAHALGGEKRRNRNLAYWKYINLLSGANPDDYTNLPGTFPALDPNHSSGAPINVPRSGQTTLNKYKGTRLRHTLTTVAGVGHNAKGIYGSQAGRNALFADQARSGSGGVPDLSKELDGYTADAAGAKIYADDADI